MKRAIRLLMVSAILTGTLVGTGVSGAAAAGKATYYLSLGDSLAEGFQPTGNDSQGYADQLFKLERDRFAQLRLVKLGCGGESTTTMIYGGICSYSRGSQLGEAVAFLQAHASDVAFVTIDVGANDVLGTDGVFCWDPSTGVFDLACVQGQLPNIQSNLALIIDALRGVAPGVSIAGMSYYDPFLGYWVLGPDGQALARSDHETVEALNDGLADTYQSEGAIVADVAGPKAFDTGNFTDMVETKQFGEVPVNVANACDLTWFCLDPPLGPDIHADTVGYGIIAGAFEAVLMQ